MSPGPVLFDLAADAFDAMPVEAVRDGQHVVVYLERHVPTRHL